MNAVKKSFSMPPAMHERAEKRIIALGYLDNRNKPSWSAYIQKLITEDLSSRPKHVTIREEPKEDYRSKAKPSRINPRPPKIENGATGGS